MIRITTRCMHIQKNNYILLLPDSAPQLPSVNCLQAESLPHIPSGSFLGPGYDQTALQALSCFWHPVHGQRCYWLQARNNIVLDSDSCLWSYTKTGFSLAWITLSDQGHLGRRPDSSGPQIPDLVQQTVQVSLSRGFLLPDDKAQLQGLLSNLALEQQIDLVFTTGGTGLTSRDITPEATLAVLDKRLPGLEQAMLQASLAHTSQAMLSRAVAGILDRTLLINLPGSPRAVRENLEVVLPALQHILEKINDRETECAR